MASTLATAPTLRLEFPTNIALQVTQAQFEVLTLANRDLKIERTEGGELALNPSTEGETRHRNIKIAYFLVRWIEEEGGNGVPFDSSMGFRLPNGADRSQDTS